MNPNRPLTIYKASAGSGKTFQLALTYIRLLLGNGSSLAPIHHRNRHRSTLAVTFTNKATEEMKQRIISELQALANPQAKSDFRPLLAAHFNASAQQLAQHAQAALNDILFDYGNFAISTIDSFFQRILRSFAYEAELAGNYDLELDTKRIIRLSINETLSTAINLDSQHHNPLLVDWLNQLMRTLFKQNKSFTIFEASHTTQSDLQKFVEHLTDEKFKQQREEILSFCANLQNIVDLSTNLHLRLQCIADEIHGIIDTFTNQLLAHNPKYIKNCKAITNFTSIDKVITAQAIDRAVQTHELPDIFTKELDKDIATGKGPNMSIAQAEALTEDLLEYCRQHNTIQTILKNIYSYGLLAFVLNTADAIKRENNTILIEDTNSLLAQIINGETEPFIYEKIGQRFSHFLIDEFQDTSQMQWENFKPLILEALSQNNENLIIGDVKQSIYRFRNSDSKLLDHQIQNDPLLSAKITPQISDSNFRSAPIVVEFNNRLFADLAALCNRSTTYTGVKQIPRKTDLNGYVVINNLEKEPLDFLIDNIERQLLAGYQPKDIVVLTNKKVEAAAVVEALIEATKKTDSPLSSAPILSDEALLVRSAGSVRYIIDQLKDLLSPPTAPKDAQKHRILTPAQMRLFTEILAQVRHLNPSLNDTEALTLANSTFRTQLQEEQNSPKINPTSTASIHDIVEELIQHLPDPTWRTTEAIYLAELQDIILKFSASSTPTLHDFLDFWENDCKTAAVSLSSEANAIRVMTIHKSKGLEFPCVHLPFLPKELADESNFRWYDAAKILHQLQIPQPHPNLIPIQSAKSLLSTHFANEYNELIAESTLDNLNKLYVAFTRPINELCVTLPHNATKPTSVTEAISQALGRNPLTPYSVVVGQPTQPPSHPTDAHPDNAIIIPEYATPQRNNYWEYTLIDTTNPLQNL